MTVYILRYSDDGETSHRNEGFTNKTDAKKRFIHLRKQAKEQLKSFQKGATAYETPPTEMFNFPFEQYVRKVTITNTTDLINLINKL